MVACLIKARKKFLSLGEAIALQTIEVVRNHRLVDDLGAILKSYPISREIPLSNFS